mmetsp:Transcript_7953/g.15497  ORF Transcript_7953/g.15497 Transcript_7953/m.15497 type:complete len:347 (-) Transcript_7953:38-1078(-)
MGRVMEFLSFEEGGRTARVVCRDWYYSWLGLVQSIRYWKVISSQRHSPTDLDSMIRRVPSQPHVAALKEFLDQSSSSSGFAIRHVCKSLRIHSESQPQPRSNEMFKVFRIKHTKQFGELGLIKSIAMAQVCLKSTHSLVELGLENCPNLDSSVVKAICKCKLLRKLNLSFSCYVGDEELKVICRECPKLEVLILQGLPKLTAAGLAELGQTRLKQLDLSYNLRLVTDEFEFSQAINRLPLTHLVLDRVEINEGSLGMLECKPTLALLSLSHCFQLNDACLAMLGHRFPNLRLLSLNFSSVTLCCFSEQGILRLIECMKALTLIVLPAHIMTVGVRKVLEARRISVV